MRQANPLSVRFKEPKQATIFAASQLQGDRDTQEDYFINFNDECFAIADGVGGLPNGEVASKLAAETAIWGYKLIRQKRMYWLDKKLLINRIFRSTNIALWQKQRDTGFEGGFATTLDVLVLSDQKYWLGHVGDGSAWLLRGSKLTKLTRDDTGGEGRLTKVIGSERYGLLPQFAGGRFVIGDTIVLTTDGVTHFLHGDRMKRIVEGSGEMTKSLTDAVIALLDSAQKNGSTDNMTACIVKRVAQR